MNDHQGNHENEAGSLAESLTGQVARLAASARETAASIEAEGASRRDASQLGDELIDAVTQRIERIADDCDDLERILDGFRSLAVPGGDAESDSPIEAGGDELDEPFPGDVSDPADLDDEDDEAEFGPPAAVGPRPDPPRISEGVRLLATQMSVAGSSVGEIAQRLRDEFGVKDSEEQVRELFGEPQSASRGSSPPSA
ncbi:MAG: hypothetical protein U0R51_10890 [Solirubrobacterales bacterium]